MATIEWGEAAGKWSEAAKWVGGVKPGETSDVVFGAKSANCEMAVTSKCRSLDGTNYKATLTLKALENLEIGAATVPASNVAWKWGAEAKLSLSGNFFILKTSNTTTAQTISVNDAAVAAWASSKIRINTVGVAGKYKLEEALGHSTSAGVILELVEGELNTNGKRVEAFEVVSSVSGAKKGTLTLGASTIVCQTWTTMVNEGLTFNAGTSVIETAQTFEGGGLTFATANVGKESTTGAHLLKGSNTFAKLNVQTAAKAKANEATIVTGSTSVKFAKVGIAGPTDEIEGAGIPVGTVLVKEIKALEFEMSAKATANATNEAVTLYVQGARFEQGATQTITEAFTTNATVSEPARICSANLGESFKLTKASGTVTVENTRIRDSHAEGGATWDSLESAGCFDATGNTGWIFKEATAGNPLAMML